jgi:hypothetical protein
METNLSKEIEKTGKGCGKEINHNVRNVITICKVLPKGSVFIESAGNITKHGFKAIQKVCKSPTYEFELCSSCQTKLDALTQAKQMIKTAIDEFDILQCFDVYNVVANWKDELKTKLGVEA